MAVRRSAENFFSLLSANEQFFCTFCNEAKNDAELIKTPCRHQYHKSCLLTWLETNEICPLCQQDFTRAAVLNQESVPLPIEAKVQIVQVPNAGMSRLGTVPRTRPPTRNSSQNLKNTYNLPRSAPNTSISLELIRRASSTNNS